MKNITKKHILNFKEIVFVKILKAIKQGKNNIIIDSKSNITKSYKH